MSTYIDIEILQALPFANANRDDAGQPKTVKIGGTTRGRLSSQSLKRAARFYGADRAAGLGFQGDTKGGVFYRTRYLKNLLEDAVTAKGGTEEDIERIREVFKTETVGKLSKKDNKSDTTEKGDVLIVVTQEEVSQIADLVLKNEITKAAIEEVLINSSKRDIALWGRFFASSDTSTVDGSAQVAHAFTTHPISIEDDFFVGLDDAASLYSDHAGAGHPGYGFYTTGTFYKYANINIDETIFNLLNARVEKQQLILDDTKTPEELTELVNNIVSDFINSFVLSVPQGKIRSTAHQTLPNHVRVSVRNNRPVNASTAYDDAVPQSKNITAESINRLENTHKTLERFVGKPEITKILSTDENYNNTESLNDLVETIKETITPLVLRKVTALFEKGE